MEVRPSLIILLVLSALTWAIAGDTWGPDSVGSTPSRPPVVVAGRVSPSPRPSPGGIQYVAVDTLGAVLTNITTAGLSSLLTADQDSSGGTQTGAIVGIAVPASGGAVQVGGTAFGLFTRIIDGQTPHDGPITSEAPVVSGGYAHATGSLPSAVSANGDAARTLVDRYGRTRVSLESDSGTALADGGGLYTWSTYYSSPNAIGSDQFRTVTLTNVSQQIKGSGGNVYSIILGNPNSGNSWVHVYNTANASVTVGTTTPAATYMVAANATLIVPGPVTHSTAICIAACDSRTGGGAPANDLTATVHYK